ncbi:hypothetical protein N7517_002029 [Penicillium concentricum]|uniref:Uncharacterized protein n=1 Tax=Penicillium concentricum TaxID=293559 RepID=A0A9W9SWV9_9EURO|nr:uncharacterized protein N7517_002029 [Penicillium concentricum]KAJ5384118.1 hypothetical protein N7517_002029 [Penicillium concentricum]
MSSPPQYGTCPQDESNLRLDLQLPLPFTQQILMPFDLREHPSKFLEPPNNKLLDIFPGTQAVELNDRVWLDNGQRRNVPAVNKKRGHSPIALSLVLLVGQKSVLTATGAAMPIDAPG